MRLIAHAIFGLALTFMTRRALEQEWLAVQTQDAWVTAALQVGVPVSIALGTALALAAGRLGSRPGRAFRDDALSAAGVYAAIFILATGALPRDAIGLLFVLIVATRVGPWAWWAARHEAPPGYIF